MCSRFRRYRQRLIRSPVGRRLFVKTTVVRTTWTFRLLLLAAVVLLCTVGARQWVRIAARSLVSESQLHPASAILIENLDSRYLLFETAGRLQTRGTATRVVVPILAPRQDLVHREAPVAISVAKVMLRAAHIKGAELVPIRLQEPISLNAAKQLRGYLVKERIRSVIVVTSAFRSERAFLIYSSILTPVGIQVQVEPVFGDYDPENWTKSLHGIQEVVLQLVKLWYYRIFVL